MLYRKCITPSMSIIIIATLALIFYAARVLGILGPPNLRWLLPLSLCIMAILPWILLTPAGRDSIGLKKAKVFSFYLNAIALGVGSALLVFLLGYLMFGNSTDNWFISVANNYKTRMDTSAMSFWLLNIIFTIPAIIFSPIGEEIFFRGMLQKTLEQKLSVGKSTAIECALFGVIHLVHHGLLNGDNGLVFMPISGMLWMIQIMLLGWMFAWLRIKGGSIFLSIVAHAFFNLVMNTCIFIFLWQ